MTPIEIEQHLTKKLFSDANDANRRHKKNSRKFDQHWGMCIQNLSAVNVLSEK